MNTVLEIIRAIETLTKPELYQIVRWVEEKRDEIEDAADTRTAEAALAEGGGQIPWEEVQQQCGLRP